MEKKCRRTFANGVTVENHCDFELVELGGKDAWLTLFRGMAAIDHAIAVDRDAFTLGDGVSATYWVAEGTCLGLIRDRQFIAWDTDIDFHVALEPDGEESMAAFASLLCSFKQTGFELCRTTFKGNRFTQIAFRDVLNKNLFFDILAFYRNGNGFDHWSECGVQRMPSEMVNIWSALPVCDTFLPFPNTPESYLEYRYGPDWKVPTRSRENRCRVKM